jgi:hypothetical protein
MGRDMAQPTGTYTQPTGPRIRFEVIGEAWTELTRNMGTWIVALLIPIIIVGAIAGVGYMVMVLPLLFGGDAVPNLMAVMFGYLVVLVLVLVASGAFFGALYRMAIRQIRGETPSINDLFQSFDLAPRFIVAHLLIGILSYIGFFLCVIPGLIVSGMSFLAYPILADQNVGSVDAIRMSWEALKKDALMAILFFIVLAIVAQLGAVACGIGAVITMPMLFLGSAIVYRDFFPQRFAPASSSAPNTATEPPPQPGA